MTIKLIIIGGVAGGATAAARARRLEEQADIILFERGEYISFANCGLPYYLGNIIKERKTKISKNEIKFVTSHIEKANELKVSIPSDLEHKIVDFVAELKKDEDDYLIEISPRLVVGFVRMAKASARAELREKVEKKDIELVKEIVRESLKI